MTDDELRKLAQAALDAKSEFDASRPGGFKHAFLYEAHRRAETLFRAHATPEAWLKNGEEGE